MENLDDILRKWAFTHNRDFDDERLVSAAHLVKAMFPSKRASRYNRLTRDQHNRYVVKDNERTYVAGSFREAQRVLSQCHDEDLSVSAFIALYCEG